MSCTEKHYRISCLCHILHLCKMSCLSGRLGWAEDAAEEVDFFSKSKARLSRSKQKPASSGPGCFPLVPQWLVHLRVLCCLYPTIVSLGSFSSLLIQFSSIIVSMLNSSLIMKLYFWSTETPLSTPRYVHTKSKTSRACSQRASSWLLIPLRRHSWSGWCTQVMSPTLDREQWVFCSVTRFSTHSITLIPRVH